MAFVTRISADSLAANSSRLSTWTIGTIDTATNNAVIRNPDSAQARSHSGAGSAPRRPTSGSANITR